MRGQGGPCPARGVSLWEAAAVTAPCPPPRPATPRMRPLPQMSPQGKKSLRRRVCEEPPKYGQPRVTVRGAPGHHREGLCPHGSQDEKAWRSVTTRFGLEDAACRRAVLSPPGKSPPPLAREAHALWVCASKASRLREMT